MRELCAKCVACEFMPKQGFEREFSVMGTMRLSEGESPILIIDDATTFLEWAKGLAVAEMIVDGEVGLEYTSTIRCHFDIDALSDEEFCTANSRCSVWTHLLSSERKLIICTENALQQLKVKRDFKTGDVFKSDKYGLFLTIDPLSTMPHSELLVVQKKIKRLLRVGDRL